MEPNDLKELLNSNKGSTEQHYVSGHGVCEYMGATHSSQHTTTEGRCLHAPHQLQENVRKIYPNKASQQEESNSTTLTSIGAVYRRQSKKIRLDFQVSHLRLRRQHKLVRTLPGPSNLFSGSEKDTAECSALCYLQPTVNKCTDLVVIYSIQITEVIPDIVFRAVQRGHRIEHFCGFFEEDAQSESFQSSSASETVEVICEEVKHAQTDRIFDDSPSAPRFAQAAAQLRDCDQPQSGDAKNGEGSSGSRNGKIAATIDTEIAAANADGFDKCF
ncbi:hypothetical protein F511_24120 [Dorcoceras hygrometricum]|uniref:Uncharacterized protein n=1 Tax=Dorcoceras hygrometricum TaxID=472368 RepID=A0A2Z7DDK1_9LAMI|nr:hypothetical protein F511_24120 [Dorcoceras hygrometricum]